MIEAAFLEIEPVLGTRAACTGVGRARATHYRALRPAPDRPRPARAAPPNALSAPERQRVLQVLRSPRFCDAAPAQVWATLLDEGTYLCSVASMYRLLREKGEVRERRRQAAHPPRARPELVARAPNQVWSWDITKLKGPRRGAWFSLYVILDIFSRYVPGFTVAPAESGDVAQEMIGEALARQAIAPGTLSIHADRGSSMTSRPVAELLARLEVERTHSRPHVSNDNPYSEAGFKTLKYCPAFPERFGSLDDARAFCERFFAYYNHEHRHSGIGLHTPASVHDGTALQVREERARVLGAAYAANPTRFGHPPRPPELPGVAWINDPAATASRCGGSENPHAVAVLPVAQAPAAADGVARESALTTASRTPALVQ